MQYSEKIETFNKLYIACESMLDTIDQNGLTDPDQMEYLHVWFEFYRNGVRGAVDNQYFNCMLCIAIDNIFSLLFNFSLYKGAQAWYLDSGFPHLRKLYGPLEEELTVEIYSIVNPIVKAKIAENKQSDEDMQKVLEKMTKPSDDATKAADQVIADILVGITSGKYVDPESN